MCGSFEHMSGNAIHSTGLFTSKLCKRSSTSSSLHKRSSGHSPGMQSGMSSSHNAGTVELKHCKKFSFSSVILPDSLGIEDFCLHNLDGPREHLAVQLQIVEEFSFFLSQFGHHFVSDLLVLCLML